MTIRSYDEDIEKILENEFHHYQDNHSGACFLLMSVTAATSLVSDTMTLGLCTISTYIFIFTHTGNINNFY